MGVLNGLLLGLSTGVGCLGWCLPALGPYVATQVADARRGLRAVAEFNAGRLCGYAVVLTLAGLLGAALTEAPWLTPASGVALMVLGLLMLAHAVRVNLPGSRVCHTRAVARLMDRFPLAAGLLVGLAPCPPLLAAAGAMATGVGSGLTFMAAFLVGTSVFLAPIGLLGHPALRKRLSSFAEIAAGFAALWFIAHGVALCMAVR